MCRFTQIARLVEDQASSSHEWELWVLTYVRNDQNRLRNHFSLVIFEEIYFGRELTAIFNLSTLTFCFSISERL
jgi:hypothetical protein